MTLIALRYFVAAAEFSSFSKAADNLYVSQPTLSRKMSELEHELGVLLFIRRAHSVELTAAGHRLYTEAVKIIKNINELKNIVAGRRNFLPLNIGYVDVFNNVKLTQAVQSVTSSFEGVEINFIRVSVSDMRNQFDDGRLDVILTSRTLIPSMHENAYIKISDNPIKIVLSSNHPLAGKESISLCEVADENIITYAYEGNPYAAKSQLKIFEKLNIQPSTKQVALDATNIQVLVAAGKGIAFLTEENRKQNIPGVSYHEINGCELNEDIVLCYKRTNHNPLLPILISEFKKIQKSKPILMD